MERIGVTINSSLCILLPLGLQIDERLFHFTHSGAQLARVLAGGFFITARPAPMLALMVPPSKIGSVSVIGPRLQTRPLVRE